MEKARLCRRGLYSLSSMIQVILVLLFFGFTGGDLFAQKAKSQNEKTLEVEVEVPIVSADRASALKSAQGEAFKKAMSLVVPASSDDESKAVWIKSASTYVKSFRLLSDKEEAGKLIAKYRVDLNLPDFNSSQPSAEVVQEYEDRFAVEFVWKNPKNSVSVTDLRDKLEASYSVKPGMIRMSRGSVWVEIISRKSPRSIFSKLKREYRSVADLKLYEDPYGFLGEDVSNAQQP